MFVFERCGTNGLVNGMHCSNIHANVNIANVLNTFLSYVNYSIHLDVAVASIVNTRIYF